MEALITFLVLLALGYIMGRMNESKHYRSIEARERKFLNLPAVTMKNALDEDREVIKSELVAGNVVVSVDFFKQFLAGLRKFFGGRVISYESLLDRARREAILRMKEMAKGADIIMNMRTETSSISKGAKKAVGTIEILAYGTAITYDKRSSKPSPVKEAHAEPSVETRAQVSPESCYRIVFSGEIAPGQDIETVKSKVAALYKIPVERCERMFSGRPVTIKKDVDYQTAQKYKTAFERTGAICKIEEC